MSEEEEREESGLRGWDGTCLVCEYFSLAPAGRAVDPTLAEGDEADMLCAPHRARMTEGLCVLCGRRAPWMDLTAESWIGWCRECFVARYGEEGARRAEEAVKAATEEER